jgi:hypothetical protein
MGALMHRIMTEAEVDRLARLRLLIVILTVVPVAISLMMSAVPTVSVGPTASSLTAGAQSVAHHITPPGHEKSPDHRHKPPGSVPLAVTQAVEADDQPVDWVPGTAGVVAYLTLDVLRGVITNRAPPATRAGVERTLAELQVWRA